MRSNVKLLQVAVSAILATRCGGTTTGPATGPSTAAVQITASPQTIVYAACPPSHCGPLAGQLEIEATLTIRETAGVSVTATRLALTIRRRSDNAALASNDVVAASAPLRVSAGGSTAVSIAMHFDASAAEANMKVVVALEGTDANGHQVTSSAEVEVRAP
jgi:hypothetical protein